MTRPMDRHVNPGKLARTIRIRFDENPKCDVRSELLKFFMKKFKYEREWFESIGQLRGSRDWYIMLTDSQYKTDFLRYDDHFLPAAGCKFTVDSFCKRSVMVRVHWLPPFIEDEILDEYFSSVGEILEKGWDRDRNTDLKSGVKWYRMLVSADKFETVPHITRFGDFQALIVMPGRPSLCLRCSGYGHQRRECEAVACKKCRSFKHDEAHCNAFSYANRVGSNPVPPEEDSSSEDENENTCAQGETVEEDLEEGVEKEPGDGSHVNPPIVSDSEVHVQNIQVEVHNPDTPSENTRAFNTAELLEAGSDFQIYQKASQLARDESSSEASPSPSPNIFPPNRVLPSHPLNLSVSRDPSPPPSESSSGDVEEEMEFQVVTKKRSHESSSSWKKNSVKGKQKKKKKK